ncbi:MAG TPA: signal peptidase II [Rhizomicrobium sp.]|nr:signal peptidase II [Rhizomicrobium sp.]
MNRRIAAGCAILALALNILLEHWLMGAPSGAVILPGLADFHPAWNRGVSFSLLTQDNDTGRRLLMALLAAVSLGVAALAWRAATRLSAAGYGLVLGGALGNLLDRALYGAVFDFLFLHLGSLALFVCNFADIAISAGVVLLLADSLAARPRSSEDPSRR